MEPKLHETLRRLDACIDAQSLSRSDLLNPAKLAAQTALSLDTVQALLRGEDPDPGDVEQRVTSRIRALAAARVARGNNRMSDLVVEVAQYLNISLPWARKLLNGEKMPNVSLLHGIAEFFQIEGGEAFFTAPPADALNRVLLPVLREHETPSEDPIEALLRKHGVVATDLRMHGKMTAQQLDDLLGSVLRSILPRAGGEQE